MGPTTAPRKRPTIRDVAAAAGVSRGRPREVHFDLLGRVLAASGVSSVVPTPGGLEVVRRTSASGSWLFALNHTASDVPLHVAGHDLVADRRHEAGAVVPARGVVVVRED